MAARAFDVLALRYDELWTHSTIGRLQRAAVWQRLDRLFSPGHSLLDLGCGTGEDALHFMSRGMRVRAIDASPEMARIARSRGVSATMLPIEQIDRLSGSFDGLISDFGVLNCVQGVDALRRPLARLVRPGGYLAICVMGCCCLWETAWYLIKAQPRKAFRRWSRRGAMSSLGVRVYYPSIDQLRQAFQPEFSLVQWCGIGVSVPPSYVTGLSDQLLLRLARIETRVADWPLCRAVADHRLLIFYRK